MGEGKIGTEGEGFLKTWQRLVDPAQGHQHVAESIAELGYGLAASRDGPAHPPFRLFVMASLVGDHPQQVQCVGFVGLDRDYLAVQPLGLAHPARPMVRDGDGQGVLYAAAHIKPSAPSSARLSIPRQREYPR
jgi:hypothetical protein